MPAVPAQAASAKTVSGTVGCVKSGWPVGVWVDGKTSKDGWATTKPAPASGGLKAFARNSWSFRLKQGGDYKLHVGCGGTSKKWKMTATTSWTGKNHNYLCNDIPPWQAWLWRLVPGAGKWKITQGIKYGTCKAV